MFAEIRPDDVPLDRRWRYHSIDPGNTLCGWVLGPLVMTVVHWSGDNSKPCHHAMTGGRLPCKCQTEKLSTRKLGYLPLFTASKERVVIIVSNLLCPRVQKYPHAAPLKFSRSNVPCTPLIVTDWPSYEVPTQQTKYVEKWKPADIQPWLLHLWQDDTLTGYFAALRSASEQLAEFPPATPTAETVLAERPAARDNVVSLNTPLIRRRRQKDSA